MRFNEILDSLKPISSKTLSAKLKLLTDKEIMDRKVISDSPVLITYSLKKKGKDLNNVMDAIADMEFKMEYDIKRLVY